MLLLVLAWGVPCWAASTQASVQIPMESPDDEVGLPLFGNFAPKDYGARPQNWAIVQDRRGIIYVGNGDGVLEFDGLRWRLIQVSNRTSVRSLAVDDAGRVWVGAIGEFGYLHPDPQGQLEYVSLMPRVAAADRGFTDVRGTLAASGEVYFASAQRLFRLRGEQLSAWSPQAELTWASVVDGRLLLHERGRGLLTLERDELRVLPGSEPLAGDFVRIMLPAGGNEKAVLIGTRGHGLFRWNGGELRPWPTEIDPEIKRHTLYSGLNLPSGRLLLGTLRGGLFVLDGQGRLIARLRKEDGLLDDTAYALANDREGGAWLALDRGVARVSFGQPLTLFDDRSGLGGTVISIHRHRGRLYVGTNLGLFRLVPGVRPRFEAVPGVDGQVWALKSVDDDLWMADNAGVFSLTDSGVVALRPSDQNALALHLSDSEPRRVFIGQLRGLASMRFEQGRWIDEGPIEGIEDQVRSVTSTIEGELWAGTRSTGVLRLQFPHDWRTNPEGLRPSLRRYGLAEGLPDLNHVHVQTLRGSLAFLTHQGIFRFDEATQRFTPDARFASLFPRRARWIRPVLEMEDGTVWAGAKDEDSRAEETGAAIPSSTGGYVWEDRGLRPLAGNATETIYAEQDKVWFGGPYGLFRYDRAEASAYDRPYRALLRRVVDSQGRSIFGGSGITDTTTLAYDEARLRFEYAAPSYEGLEANRFQFLLEGNDRDWSEWSAESYQDYSRLFEGTYRFRVRARNLFGAISDEATFDFRVLPPWYRSAWAWLAYSVVLILAARALVNWRLRRLQAQKGALERTIDQRTRQLASLGEIGREITARLDLDAVFDTLYVQINRVLDADVFGIGIYHADRGEIEFRMAIEKGQRFEPYVRRMEDKDQLAVWCIEHREPILMGDYPSEVTRYLSRPDELVSQRVDGSRQASPNSAMYAPLLLKGEVLGVLGVHSFRAHAYDRSQLDILQTLAAYTATAMDNATAHTTLARSHEELRATHRHLLDAQQQLVLQEKMASLGQLVAGVAHEINTPLGIALTASTHLDQQSQGLVSRLESGAIEPGEVTAHAAKSIELSRLIESNLHRAAQLVRSFKQVSVDRASDDRRQFALAAYLQDLVQSLNPTWKRRPMTLKVECDPDIRMDSFPGALGQVVTNLIQNALLHGFAPDTKGSMQLSVRRIEGERIELTFLDDGRGIAPEHLPRIFDPFFTTRRGRGGTGLGLHVTFNLVTQTLGGSIEVQSELGRGTRFVVTLPLVA